MAAVSSYLPQMAAGSYAGAGPVALPKNDDEALRMIAREFESIFIGEMMKSMRIESLESTLFGQDRASKMYREMHDQAVAREMAMTGRMGIADMVYNELSRRPGGPR